MTTFKANKKRNYTKKKKPTKATNRKQETEKIYRYVDREILNMKMHKIMSYRSNYQYLLDHRESKRVPEKHVLLLY